MITHSENDRAAAKQALITDLNKIGELATFKTSNAHRTGVAVVGSAHDKAMQQEIASTREEVQELNNANEALQKELADLKRDLQERVGVGKDALQEAWGAVDVKIALVEKLQVTYTAPRPMLWQSSTLTCDTHTRLQGELKASKEETASTVKRAEAAEEAAKVAIERAQDAEQAAERFRKDATAAVSLAKQRSFKLAVRVRSHPHTRRNGWSSSTRTHTHTHVSCYNSASCGLTAKAPCLATWRAAFLTSSSRTRHAAGA